LKSAVPLPVPRQRRAIFILGTPTKALRYLNLHSRIKEYLSMLKIKAMIPALLLSAVTLAPASALSGKLSSAAQVAPMELKVQNDRMERRDRDGDRDFKRGGDRDFKRDGDRDFRRGGDRDFRQRGDRYYGRGYVRRDPPRGWSRFGYRPNDWRTRGCLEIGPAWFCP
jgi:hypothetical protein